MANKKKALEDKTYLDSNSQFDACDPLNIAKKNRIKWRRNTYRTEAHKLSKAHFRRDGKENLNW